jgi:hypothetical protein
VPGRLLPFLLLLAFALPAPPAVADPVATSSVVGGKDADIADWPSIAFLLAAWDEDGDGDLDSAAGCTGTVIAPQWILSAAHCAFRPDDQAVDAMLAVTGSADINDEAAEAIAADDVAVHPAWDPRTVAGDALLVHLESASARPAMPLARTGGKFHLEDAVTNLAGWGTTDEDNTISTDILQDAHVSIADDATCAQFDAAYDPATQTCAGEYQTAGACHGDSGGPLTVLDAAGTPHLWGLTSYGPARPASYKECDLRIPVIFTWVPAHAGWIDATLAGLPWPPPREDPDPGPVPGPGPSRPPADTKPPVLSAVKLSTKRIRPARRGATIARKVGATLSFTLDEPAAVTVGVRKGRRQRGRVATFAADAGHTTKRFSARVGGRKLRRGRYRLRVSAVDVAGNAAPSRTIGFKVV